MRFLLDKEQTPKQTPQFVYILYGGLIIYFIYKMFKSHKSKKMVAGEKHVFSKETSSWVYILGAFIVAMGAYNIYLGELTTGLLMIGLVVLIIIDMKDKIIIGESGIYGQSQYISWDDLKQWAFDKDRSELVMKYKIDFNERMAYIRVRPEDIVAINNLIRRFKLNK